MSFHSLVNLFFILLDVYNRILSSIRENISEYSPSQCKIPKLHVLRYHVILSIQLYGSMNGMSTETYETLHKTNVKNPYRMTNKRNCSTNVKYGMLYNTIYIVSNLFLSLLIKIQLM